MDNLNEFVKSHRKLLVWQKSIELAKQTYILTALFPKEEMYGLSMQIRRSAVSIASNIAEGAGRKNNKEKIQFFSIAQSSPSELDTQVEIISQLNYCLENTLKNYISLLNEVSRLLSGLIRSRTTISVSLALLLLAPRFSLLAIRG